MMAKIHGFGAWVVTGDAERHFTLDDDRTGYISIEPQTEQRPASVVWRVVIGTTIARGAYETGPGRTLPWARDMAIAAAEWALSDYLEQEEGAE